MEEELRQTSRIMFNLVAAARVNGVLCARHETTLRSALIAWRAFFDFDEESSQADALLMSLAVGRSPSAQQSDRRLHLMANAVRHLRPVALTGAMRRWSQNVSAIARDAQRASSAFHLTEGKWALQRAMSLERATKLRLVGGVLRWWQQGELAHGWARWQAAMAAMGASPYVQISE